MGHARQIKIEFLPDRVGSALRAAKATRLRIGDWTADGLEVLRSISFVLKHGITALEFSAFLSRLSKAPVDLCLESVADWTLRQLVQADMLETDPRQEPCEVDRRLYRLSPLGYSVLKDRRARPQRTPDGA